MTARKQKRISGAQNRKWRREKGEGERV